MKKYLFLLLPMFLAGCANTVEVDRKVEYKCGEQIVWAEFLDDDSLILRINGVNNVLSRAKSSSGRYYENTAAQISFKQKGGDDYLSIKDHTYPLCFEIER